MRFQRVVAVGLSVLLIGAALTAFGVTAAGGSTSATTQHGPVKGLVIKGGHPSKLPISYK